MDAYEETKLAVKFSPTTSSDNFIAQCKSIIESRVAISDDAEHTLTVLHACNTFKALLPLVKLLPLSSQDFLSLNHELTNQALARYNKALQAEDLSEAIEYLDALTELVPENKTVLELGFALGKRIGQPDHVKTYARALLNLEPNHLSARQELASLCQSSGDIAGEAVHRIAMARLRSEDTHTVFQLHNTWEALNCILLTPFDTKLVALVNELTALARDIPPGQSTPDDPYDGWETHYRLAIDAVDLSAFVDPMPHVQPYPEIRFATSAGDPIELSDLCDAASHNQAEVVFFVAADENYVQLYAAFYISSVLKNCDIAFLILVHVIGAIDNLPTVTKSVGIQDSRLIYSADSFHPTNPTSRCYRPPPIGWCGFAAHYQSARFLWLGYFLKHLRRPVFVSDIDLLLQRGVDDLLKRCAEEDVVLNENTGSRSYSSRITANLMLIKPTDAAAHFAHVVRHYLDRALHNDGIHYMIDQCALFFARQILSHTFLALNIGSFDNESDINNFMYKTYAETPYRFFSLYHGFDLSSLKPAIDANNTH